MAVVIKSEKKKDQFAPFASEYFSRFVADLDGNDPLASWRKESFAEALSAPLPTNRDEEYKYVNFRLLDLDAVSPAVMQASKPANGEIVIANGDAPAALPERWTIESNISNSNNGVFLGSFADAVSALQDECSGHLELFARRFPRRKFAHLAHAFSRYGVLLHVSNDARDEHPRHLYTYMTGSGLMTSSATLAVIGANARANLIWDVMSEASASGLANNALEVLLRSGSHLTLLLNQEHGRAVNSIMTARIYLERDTEMELVTLNAGGRLSLTEIDIQLAGEGANASVSGVYVGRGEENFNLLTHQDHRLGHSKSDLFYAGTLSGKSRSNYLGKITIAPGAQRSDAYQRNRNLVLNSGVAVNSSPKLEIRANDVRCSHGATTSKVSDLEMFYLRSRGIDKTAAKVLLSDGFLGQAAERLRSEMIRRAFDRRLRALLSGWAENEKSAKDNVYERS